MNRSSVEYLGIKFKNPIITASGTFGFGEEYGQYFDLSKLGGISVKGLTLNKRLGNMTPRIAETPAGILNSVGLQNPGVEHFVKVDLPKLKKYDTRIIANMSGNTMDEYVEMARILSDSDIDIIEMNISCPNVKEGGKAFGTDEKVVFEITEKVKNVSNKPLVVKLTPNVTDIKGIARAAQDAGADGISLINTLLGMKIDIRTKKPVLYNNVGGLSGPCVMPIAVRMVHEVYKSVDIPIMGMGGVSCMEDVLEFMIAGSRLVAIGTYNFRDPLICPKIIDQLENYLEKENIDSVEDIIGSIKLNG